jgi:hypothetical protein
MYMFLAKGIKPPDLKRWIACLKLKRLQIGCKGTVQAYGNASWMVLQKWCSRRKVLDITMKWVFEKA